MNWIVRIAAGFALAVSFSGLLFGAGESPLVIESVRPNKVLYKLDENATAKITLTNKSGREQKGTLVVTEFRDLNESRVVARVPITLAPNETKKEVVIRWNAGPSMYGRELRAEFGQPGVPAPRASEFYQVADKWIRVNIISHMGEEKKPELGPFDSYSNHGMWFSWAPSDFGDLPPDLDARFPTLKFFVDGKQTGGTGLRKR